METTPQEAPAPTEALAANEQPKIQSYWGTKEKKRFNLPDGVQWFEFQIMTEGDKKKFQAMTNTDLVVDQNRTATVRVDPAKERHTLIKNSVTDWCLYQPDNQGGMVPAPFSSRNLENWLEIAPPKVVEDLEYEIRMANPWMQAEMIVDEIDKEIERLQKLRIEARARELGESSSTSR